MDISNASELLGTEKHPGFLVAGIGASAGGIQALKVFFEHVPEDSGIAYVVILHLSPDHDSQLASVLQAGSSIPVIQVTENTKLEPDHVYVVPPDQHLIIKEGYIAPSRNTNIEDRRAPVDIFFRNLANTHGARAICVVLSGTGANGSMGLKRIKEMGGVTFVQSPREAQFNEMPRNSIATDLVDEVLPVAEIPARIIAYRDSLGSVQIVLEGNSPVPQQQALDDIFSYLRFRTGHDFSNYKRPTLLRRIERRINIRNLPDLPSYVDYLNESPDEVNALLKDLLISVTNFFRDPKPFQTIEREVLPSVLSSRKSNSEVRIWVAGCATGEEAYSLAMLCAELTTDRSDAPRVQIFATDIDEPAIATARAGFYTLNDAADVSPERLKRFFNPEGKGFRVSREIREMVVFANHNFLKDSPFSRLSLITCRNVLIYLNTAAQGRVMEIFHFALQPGGFLFLGNSESLDGASDLYSTFNRENHIFQAREVTTRHYPVPGSVRNINHPKKELQTDQYKEETFGKRNSLAGQHHNLLEEYAPPSVVVNEDYEIVHLSEKVGRFFQVQGGEPSHNLLKLVRPELRLELHSALYQAVNRKSPVEIRNLKVVLEGKPQSVDLQVRPVFGDKESSKGFILVIFEQKEEEPGGQPMLLSSDEPIAKRLEEELINLKSELRSSLEQHGFQAEELKASNEELQAMNEELRSSAEELETRKEELQSINEELRTVNQELKVKIEETSIAGNNFQNLINSTDVGTIFLDRDFRIKMFTPSVLQIFNLIPSDYGRPVSDITHKLEFANLMQDAEKVLEKLSPIDREVLTTDGRSFLMRLLPYRTKEDIINGVVVTFYEVTKRKQAEKALQQSEEHLRLLIESARDYAIFTLDPERRVLSWSIGAEMIIGYTAAEIHGKSADLIFTQTDREAGAPIEETENANSKGRAENERWHLRKDGSRFWGSGSVSPLRDGDGKLVGFVKIMRDLTETRRLEEARLFLASVVETSNDSVLTIDFERTITSWNKAAEALYGYSAEEAIGRNLTMLTLPEDLLDILKTVDKIEHSRQTVVFDTVRMRKGGAQIELEIVMSPVLNTQGKVIGVSTIARDVSERKRREKHLAFLADLSQGLIGLSFTTGEEQNFTEKIAAFFEASACVFSETNGEESNTKVLGEWHRSDQHNVLKGDMLPDYANPELRKMLVAGNPVIVENLASDPRAQIPGILKDQGIISFVSVPIMHNGRRKFSLSVYLDHAYNWREDEVSLLTETGIRIWNSLERARAEEALHISEERFRTLTDAIPQVIWSNDGKGKANYFNQRWFEYSGLTFEQSYGLGWEAIVHPEDAPASSEKWQNAQAEGKIFDSEYRLRNSKGEFCWHIGRNVPLKDNRGRVIGWFGSATDIQGLKSSEALLRQTAERLQLALDAGELGSYEYSLQTGVTISTPQHIKNFGYPEDEQGGFEEFKALILPEDRNYVDAEFDKAIKDQTVFGMEFRIQQRSGAIKWIKSVGRVVLDDNAKPEKIVGITVDITDQKSYTEELQKEVAERTVELQRSNEDLRQFAHVASHDLKEPVRKIKTFNNRILDEYSDLLPENVKLFLGKIQSATDRMYTMIDGVLAYSKLGNSIQSFGPVDINEVIKQIEGDLEILMQTKRAVIKYTGLPTINASSVLIYQLFYNLILNSLKFAKSGHPSIIEITSMTVPLENRDFARILVTDNGIGFEPEFETAVFNTFTRLNAADEYEGTGLGLALCKKIVERHHGTISARSNGNEGATFTILLPLNQRKIGNS